MQLIDLYSLWACRHLYLKEYDRWPGRQAVIHPYERILELKLNEYCGCDHSNNLYGDCCHRKDLKCNRIAEAVNFTIAYHGGYRKPPKAVTDFILYQSNPPQIHDLLSL